MARAPFIEQARCWCCPTCEPEGGSGGCTGVSIPRYFSLRLSSGFGAFPSDVPITWGEGTDATADSTWCWMVVSKWLKRHVAGEGPDIVLEYDSGAYEADIDFSGVSKDDFTDSDVTDPNNAPTVTAATLILRVRLTFSGDTATLKIGFETTTDPFFDESFSLPCNSRWAIEDQPYTVIPNTKVAAESAEASDTEQQLANKRVYGGTAYLRPCAGENRLNGGGPWLQALIDPISGDFVTCYASSRDISLAIDYCDYGEFNSGRLEFVNDGTVDFYNGGNATKTTTGYSGLVCGGTPTFGPFDATQSVALWNDELMRPSWRFGGGAPTFYAPPWAQSNGFDPINDTLADAQTLTLWVQTGFSPLVQVEAGTVAVNTIHSGGACSVPPWLTSVCRKYSDAGGFTFTNLQLWMSAPGIVEPEFYAGNIGATSINANNIDRFAAHVNRVLPWVTVTYTAHGTAPLLSDVTVTGWNNNVLLRLTVGGSLQSFGAC